MAPKRRATSEESFASDLASDSTFAELVNKGIELKRDQQKQYKQVIKETQTELDKLLAKFEASKKKQRQEATKEQAKHITTIIENMERRKEIELEVQKILADVQGRTEEVEQMMLVGYDGRLEAMNKALEAGQAKRRREQGGK